MYATTYILPLILFLSSSFAQDDFIISACNDEDVNIGCTRGKKLNIRKAIYCYHDSTTECCSSDHTSHVIIGLCQNKPRCRFQVGRYLFGDQCGKYENNITIYYTCEDPLPGCGTSKCKKYETWNSKASICPKMCPNNFLEPKNCPVDEACTCIKDYVLDRRTMSCIPEIYCPKSDEKNEKFSRCCAAQQRYCPGPIVFEKNVTTECIPGYVCKKCLYRDISGHCVPFGECPQLKG